MLDVLWNRFWRIWGAGALAACVLALPLAGSRAAVSFLAGGSIGAVSLLLVRETARLIVRAAVESSASAGTGARRRGRAGRALILGGRLILIAAMLKVALLWNGLHLPAFAIGLGYTQAVVVVYSLAGGFAGGGPAE